MSNTTSLTDLKAGAIATRQEPDQRIDLFSARGFALACKLANAFASSDAVPAAFRNVTQKGKGTNVQWVENPAAIGNCIVAIETAQAVGMSVTAVMQNADVIEGKLRWSDKFVIAAINASGRFAPLRFDVQNLGKMKAQYREKLGWNDQKKGYDFEDRTVEIENQRCVAWTLPIGEKLPPNVYTLAQAKAAGLPVIEGPAVSIKLAVEEGWYSKPGSKWQTEMKDLMLTYRAGRFFGNIHAPDIVMGMGQTSDEARDIIDINPAPAYTEVKSAPVTLDEIKTQERPAETPAPEPAGEPAQQAQPVAEPAPEGRPLTQEEAERLDYERSIATQEPEQGTPAKRTRRSTSGTE